MDAGLFSPTRIWQNLILYPTLSNASVMRKGHTMNVWLNPAWAIDLLTLRHLLVSCDSLLDIGCGPSSPARFIPANKTGIDAYGPSLETARANGTHQHFIQDDVRNIQTLFKEHSFDATIALDLIEHLPKNEGWILLDNMERIARKRVVVFTPNGFMPQANKEDGDLQEHLSGWTTHDFASRGYRVYGINGWKRLRSGMSLKYKPKVFWAVISSLTQLLYCQTHPESASAILAVKIIE
jgi:SAM-dependent methyltransferase